MDSPSQAARLMKRINKKAEKQEIRKISVPSAEDQPGKSFVSFATPALLYPNPSTGRIFLNLPLKGKWDLMVMDLQGKKLMKTSFEGQQHQLDLSNFPQGTYVVKATAADGDYQKSFRLIKE